MIFRPELVRLIAAGRKTQTRRPVRGDEDRGRYKVGKSYAVQPGRGKPSSFRIVVTDVRQGPLGDLTLADAQAEGFRTTDEFRLYWVGLHDKAWAEKPVKQPCECWTHGHRQGDHFWLRERAEWELLARFERRHAGRQVWIITFRLDTAETPRFLSAGWPDYVTSPALAFPGEPEAVPAVEQATITERAGMATAQWQALEEGHRERELRLLGLEERIVRARRVARLRNVDIERELWMVERLRQQGRTDEAVVHRLRGAERKIDRSAA